MPKAKTERETPWRYVPAGALRKRRARHHWFDHPEMQARIAKAEADLREGRYKDFDSAEDAFAYLRSLD